MKMKIYGKKNILSTLLLLRCSLVVFLYATKSLKLCCVWLKTWLKYYKKEWKLLNTNNFHPLRWSG